MKNYLKGLTRIEKIKFIFLHIFRLLLLIAGIISVIEKDWLNLGLVFLTLFLTYLPTMIESRYKVDFPTEFDLAILVFIYASLYLGNMHLYYERFWWWDVLLHTFSGIIFGILGFSLVNILNKEKNVSINLSPFFVALFSFSFALALGTLWEIFEFFVDTNFGFNMQRSGLVDTMWDLIVDSAGALLISVVGYFYLKSKKTLVGVLENTLKNKS